MRYVIGIDEVGRGCLAGPVVVAAVAVPTGFRVKNQARKIPLRDSKKLTAAQRETWFKYLRKHPALYCSIAAAQPREIERLNIAQAANVAAFRAYQKLIPTLNPSGDTRYPIYLDGGLYLGRRIAGTKVSCAFGGQTVVKADEKFNAVKIASILAKVHRDRLMRKLSKKYPAYGLEVHKGYATKKHRQALLQHGPAKVHRLTFLKNYATFKTLSTKH